MNLPGFNADNSLYRRDGGYRLTHDPNQTGSGSIKPAFVPPDFRFGPPLLTDPGPEYVEVCKPVIEYDPDTGLVQVYLDCHHRYIWH